MHDRVQQAAYSLIPEDQKQATHLEIARLLRQSTPDTELEAKIFQIVNHWNNAIAIILDQFDQSEKDNLAQLNLIAGRKAKASNAYEPAFPLTSPSGKAEGRRQRAEGYVRFYTINFCLLPCLAQNGLRLAGFIRNRK